MKVKMLAFLLVVAFLGFSLSGCLFCRVDEGRKRASACGERSAAYGERRATSCSTGTTCGER